MIGSPSINTLPSSLQANTLQYQHRIREHSRDDDILTQFQHKMSAPLDEQLGAASAAAPPLLAQRKPGRKFSSAIRAGSSIDVLMSMGFPKLRV